MQRKRQIALIILSVFLALFAVGCKKETPPQVPPAPLPPKPAPLPKPTASLTAEPSSIERGKSATLKWSSSNATSASLNQGIGSVRVNGSREVFPTQTTTYTLTAKGQGGEASATSTVTVRVPPPPQPPKPPKPGFSDALSSSAVRDAYFDYDQSDVHSDAQATLRSNATALKKLFSDYPSGRVVIEGHCDERGTNEYNLALGDRRATAARGFLVGQGVPAGKLTTISYGEERPQCTASDESCWQRNRRAHFSAAR